ncbi:zinc transporter 2-like [Gigantopelta aegis]|uniref:zinc transporter 2-like n=1 Tax=Gigantopelta aegis TaxID=1735272 RepID=UPI001B888441|nr:zinc transporter 2-like [Gigantopelta aegis]
MDADRLWHIPSIQTEVEEDSPFSPGDVEQVPDTVFRSVGVDSGVEGETASAPERWRRKSHHRCVSAPLSEKSDFTDDSDVYTETSKLTDCRSNGWYPGSDVGHCHDKSNTRQMDKKARNKLITASVFCLIFLSAEAAGGILAGSLAIVSDAAHLLTDFASFLVSLLALYLGTRPATKKLSFGWYRAEILGALMSILVLWVLTGILCYSAVERVISNQYEINATIMLITAAVGVAFNLLHVAAFIIYFKPEYKIADPICTFFFSGLVLLTTMTVLRDILVVLMEGTPKNVDFSEVRQTFYEIDGVKDIHNLRVWSLTLDKIALSVHIAVDKDQNPLVLIKDASRRIKMKYGIVDTTMQIEEYVDEMQDCTKCQDLKD